MTSRLKARVLAQRALLQRLQGSKKRNPLQAGFTLIELLVVVIIIGILAAIAIPNFISQRDRGYEASAKSWASSEARKCGASLAATNSDADFNAKAQPTELGTNVTATGATTCAATSAWSVTFDGTTTTWTVGEGGSVDQTTTP